MKTVHAVAGIICSENDELLVARRDDGTPEGLWEFPGGEIGRGEEAVDACARVLRERLAVDAGDVRAFFTVEHDEGGDVHLSIACFLCRIEEGGPLAESGGDLRWVPREKLGGLSWAPAMAGLVEALMQAGDAEGDARQVKRRRDSRKSMQGNKRANTKPELLVRRRLREAGLTGYRLQWKQAPGRPDIAFPGRKVAIFVNGCFWHRCPTCRPSTPKRNTEFWEAKFRRNVERDARAVRELEKAGWTVVTIWECELKRDRIDETMAGVIETVRAHPHPRAVAR